MGKKKRPPLAKVRDERGYQTTSTLPVTKKAETSFTKMNTKNDDKHFQTETNSKMSTNAGNDDTDIIQLSPSVYHNLHDTVLKLRETLASSGLHGNTTSAVPNAAEKSLRFRKRIGNIYDSLLSYGFTLDHVRRAVEAEKYGVTLDSALDWLCLHLPMQELPLVFTETFAQDERNESVFGVSTKSLDVLAPKPLSEQSNRVAECEQVDNNLHSWILASVPESTKEDVTIEKSEQDAERQRILEQYQYVCDEDDGKGEDGQLNKPLGKDAGLNVSNIAGSDGEVLVNDKEQLSTEELELLGAQQELKDAETDAKDDAANYMRSKHDNKELNKNIRMLQNKVKMLSNKVKRQKAKVPLPPPSRQVGDISNDVSNNKVASEKVDEVLDDMCLLSVFDEREDIEIKASVTSVSPKRHVPPIPKTWTGKTPKQLLEDICRKQKGQKLSFSKVGQNGCKLIVSQGKNKSFEFLETELDARYLDTQHYISTVALYKLNKNMQIYRLLPPFYHDLWKSWLDEEKSLQNSSQQAVKDEREAAIQFLINSIQSPPMIFGKPLNECKTESDIISDACLDTWDDVAESFEEKSSVLDFIDEKVEFDFCSRRNTSFYKKMLCERSQLPMYKYRDTILETVHCNPVTVISADTGAGKSTQCPQFLLEDSLLMGRTDTSIICTQPRRVAATSLAERVSEEMGENSVGKLVGYQIRLESCRSQSTRLLFCTTGVILRRLVDDPALSGVTHVIVDEVHERQWQIDVLLVALKSLLCGPRRDLKIILMSATLDADLFRSFFYDAPHVDVPGRTFPISSFYLEDLFEQTGHVIEEGSFCAVRDFSYNDTTSLWITTKGGEKRKEQLSLQSEVEFEVSNNYLGYSLRTRRSMDRVDETRINYDLIEDLLIHVLVDSRQLFRPPEGADMSKGAVLIFLPGFGEIRVLMDRLNGSRIFGDQTKFDIVPLHSSIASYDQKRAFKRPPLGRRKIIISTNIAETSVTIPDVVCVIDCGRLREMTTDKQTSTPRLLQTWCSRASAKQRAGRAGRVQPGICLKLFSSRTEKLLMKARAEPELKRIPLEEVCLTILATGLATNCAEFLGRTPEPPISNAISGALEVLRDLGAVSFLDPQLPNVTASNEVLTALGKHLSRFPVNARVGKMLIYGAIFRCIEPILTIAACLSASQSMFALNVEEAPSIDAARAAFYDRQSDFMTLYNVFTAYMKADEIGKTKQFCRDYRLNLSALREIRTSRLNFLMLLSGLGFVDQSSVGLQNRSRLDEDMLTKGRLNKYGTNDAMIQAVILSSLYPNVARLDVLNNRPILLQKTETLSIHSTSINHKMPKQIPTRWIVFHEKLGFSNRVSVTGTSFIKPIAIVLFGSCLEVRHLERKVIVDGWIELNLAAQSVVLLKELRMQMDICMEDRFITSLDKASEFALMTIVDSIAMLLM